MRLFFAPTLGLLFPLFGLPAPGAPPPEDPLFSKIPVVEAATLHTQTLEEAPASVTVISAADIRKYGYRTLGEALSSVRGFYLTNDRIYDYSGMRGLAIPGDWNTRFLVMLNSYPLTDPVYNSNNNFGQDFGLDMDLVERIEIVRGPSSALFGSNGMLATINVITKSPVDQDRFRASVETGSFGERKAIVSTALDLGHGANLLLSLSVFNNVGRSLNFPEYGGLASHVDSLKGYHTFANLSWGHWNVLGYFNSREILVPVGWGNTLFNHQGQEVADGRSMVGASYARDLGGATQLRWQTSYDQYRYRDRWDYALDDGAVEVNRTLNYGDWVSSQLTLSRPVPRFGVLTVGVQGAQELRNLQINQDVSPSPVTVLDVSKPDRSGALFSQQEWDLNGRLKAYLGLRADFSRFYGNALSPRLALVYQPAARTTGKFIYGRPFRNPSAFERFYDDNGLSYAANPRLSRETAQAFEGVLEHKLTPDTQAIVNVYHYELHDVIQALSTPAGFNMYENAGARRSTGVELELQATVLHRIEIQGSYAIQRARNVVAERRLPNSPAQIGKTRLAIPLLRNKVYFTSALNYLSARTTIDASNLRPVVLADATLSTIHLFKNYDFTCGMHNVLNWQYDHPVDLSVNQIRANGRTYFVKLIWRIGE